MRSHLSLVLCLLGVTAWASSTAPRMGTVLADASVLGEVKPTLIAGMGNTVYVMAKSARPECRGEGLYRLGLARAAYLEEMVLRRSGAPLPTKLCATSLRVEHDRLLVQEVGQGQQVIEIGTDPLAATLKSALLGQNFKGSGVWNWTLAYLKHNGQWPTDVEWISQSFVEERSLQVLGRRKNELLFFSSSLDPRSDDPLKAPVTLSPIAEGDAVEAHFSGSKVVAFFRSQTSSKLGRIKIWDLAQASSEKPSEIPVTELGHDIAYRRDSIWDELPLEDWSARHLGATAITAEGMFVSDTTSFASEFALLAFLPFPSGGGDAKPPAIRVTGLHQPWMKALRGVAPYQKGLVLSYIEPALISYVGDQNPFDEELFRTRRPDLQEISIADYEDLLKEVRSHERN